VIVPIYRDRRYIVPMLGRIGLTRPLLQAVLTEGATLSVLPDPNSGVCDQNPC
jgi:hypothetical protein